MQRLSPSYSQRLVQVAIASVVALLVGFLFVVQLRSQAVVVRHLAGQDNTTIALLINNLNRGNTALLEEIFALESRRTRLRGDLTTGQGDPQELERETTRLRIVNGTVGVHGAGIVLRLDGSLYDFELQDTINNLRNAGAEALSLNSHRIVGRTAIRGQAGDLRIDGLQARSPFVLKVIGEAQALYDAAQLSLGALQGRATVDVRRFPEVQIPETAPPQRFVYAEASPR
jgi:uncharacterized protein YlxW (UPF0749 family)